MAATAGVRGRPRDPAVDTAVTDAVLDLLEEVGYARLTVEAVAVRAGVAKATIYRRWSSKAEMVFEVALHPPDIAPPRDTGSLHGDLLMLSSAIVRVLTRRRSAAALPLLSEIATDPALAERYRLLATRPEREIVAELLGRARRRGELRGAVDVDRVHAMLLGTAFCWLFILRRPATPDLHRWMADDALAALTSQRR